MARGAKTSIILIDAQNVRNADAAEKKGYVAGKKVSGIKRHIAVDTQGLPYALFAATADVTDRDGAFRMVGLNLETLSRVKKALVDGG